MTTFAEVLPSLAAHVQRVRERIQSLDGGLRKPPPMRAVTVNTAFVFNEVYRNVHQLRGWLLAGGDGHVDLGAAEGRRVRVVRNDARGRRGRLVAPALYGGLVHASLERTPRNRRLGPSQGRTHYSDLPRDRHRIRRHKCGVVYGECRDEGEDEWISFYFRVPALEQRRATYSTL